jgi:hypothetical protein
MIGEDDNDEEGRNDKSRQSFRATTVTTHRSPPTSPTCHTNKIAIEHLSSSPTVVANDEDPYFLAITRRCLCRVVSRHTSTFERVDFIQKFQTNNVIITKHIIRFATGTSDVDTVSLHCVLSTSLGRVTDAFSVP